MEKHKIIKDIVENAIRAGIEYKEEMLVIGRGYDLSSIAELSTRQLERALANVEASESNCTIHGVSTRFLSKDDALGYVNRTDFRFIRGDDFINRLTDAQFINLANLLDEMD